jgi:hypothetical protein
MRAEEGQVKYLKGDVSYRFIITLLRFVVPAAHFERNEAQGI